MSDLRERVPGHSLIDELLHQWDVGTIHVDPAKKAVVIDEEATGWFRGVLGERRVAEILEPLGPAWTVLHSVPVGRGTSDIDHVVVGPPGVFTINTKYSPGRDVWVGGYGMYVGGHKQHYVTNSIAEAKRAAVLLSRESRMTVPVVSIIVFVDPGPITVKAKPGGDQYDPEVLVVSDRGLYASLQRAREFSDDQVARIVDAASRPSTWHTRPQPSSAGSHITREFEALEAAVGAHVGAAVPVAPRVARKPARAVSTKPIRAVPRPASRRPTSRSRRRKRSRLERLITELAMPLAGLAMLWGILNAIGR